ncbi:MAG: hypothetical protein KAS32_07460, partial [Candidatus Peribacteraceae bacterium]|nr:hypothetical protein [Candidatus Peribacteraceae bacterium]
MAASEILANVKRQFDPGEVIEIRLKSRGGWHSGYYDYEHFEQMAADVEKYDELRETTAIYYTLNPVQNILLARCMNHIQRAKETTTDAQIKYRKYLPFDIDPERPAGVSSTNEQHEKSIEKGNRVAKWLKEEYGWPDPIKGDSGNGTHLDYRIDEPNTPEAKELVECVQKAVIEQFNDENDGIKIEGWANTARIWKLKGTMTRKGDEIPDQDIYHRRSKILAMPDELQNVTTEQLRDVAALYQPGEVTGPQKSQEQPSKKPKKGKIFDIEAWIKKYKIPVERVKKESDKTIYVLEACLINP